MLGLGLLLTNIRNRISFFSKFDFIAAYRASDDTQNIGASGTTLNIMPKGTNSATSLHNTPILSKDADEVYQTYVVDDPIWDGGRVANNQVKQSEDITVAPWSNKTSIITTGIADPDGGNRAYRVEAAAAGDRIFQPFAVSDQSGNFFTTTYWLKSITNVGLVSVYDSSNSSHPVNAFFTGEWQEFSYYAEGAVTARLYWVHLAIAGEIIEVYQPQCEKNLGDVGKGAYVATTDDVKQVTYSTDSNGTPLSPHPWQVSNDATTNLLFPSEPPVNTTVNLPANEYTLWIEGTGSITSTYGTATEASQLTFTGNATAELFTVVGSVDIAQIALGNSKGAYARSTTAASSIPATPYTYPAANIDPSSAHIAMTFDAGLVDGTLIDIGGVALLSYTAGDLVLSDGTNSSSATIAAGSHTVEIKLVGSTMQLIVDGVAEAAVTYVPIAAGLITNTTPKFYQFTAKSIPIPIAYLTDENGVYQVDENGNNQVEELL